MLAERLGAVLTKKELNAAFTEMLSYSADKEEVDFEGFNKWWERGANGHSESLSDSMNHPTDGLLSPTHLAERTCSTPGGRTGTSPADSAP